MIMEMQPQPISSLPRPAGMTTGRILQSVLTVAVVLATLFTGLPPRAISRQVGGADAWLTPVAPSGGSAGGNEPLRIGIIPGHWGNDPGAVCADGTTEAQVNLAVAQIVEQRLSAYGYNVELLMEFDPRLEDYRAALLLSIHADSCDYINDLATGYKVAASYYGNDTVLASRLTTCLYSHYGDITGLPTSPETVTIDMRDYHAFREVDPSTTAAIIEIGFLNLDYDLLTKDPQRIANGIVAGILCYTGDDQTETAPAGSVP